MFVLNPSQVRNKVIFYQEHCKDENDENILVPYVLIRDGYGWYRELVSELESDQHGNKIVTMQSKKTEKDYYWHLKDVIYIQFNEEIPAGYAVRQLEPDVYAPHNFVLRKINSFSDSNTVDTAEI
jgi:hypothetical protein